MPNESQIDHAQSILIVKPSSLGDIVHTLPAVAAIRAAHPRAKITWVINPEWAPLLRGNHDVNHVHIFPRGQFRGLAGARTLVDWWRKTAHLQPDVALDFQGLFRSAWIGRISRPGVLYGLSDGREGSRLFYDRIVRVDRDLHAVDRYLKLAEAFGARAEKPLRFPLPTGDPLPHFDEYPPFILLHPFARGARKSLSLAAVKEFCRAFAPQRVVVVGRSRRKFSAPDNCVFLTNHTTLLELIRLIRIAQVTISVDSGPMHIAAAISNRLISIHTWSDPRHVGPYNPDAWVWKAGELRQARAIAVMEKITGRRAFRPSDVTQIVEHARKHFADAPEQIRPAADRAAG